MHYLKYLLIAVAVSTLAGCVITEEVGSTSDLSESNPDGLLGAKDRSLVDAAVSVTGYFDGSVIELDTESRTETFSVSVTITNVGTENLVEGELFSVEYYLSEDDLITPDDMVIDNRSINIPHNISTGESVTINSYVTMEGRNILAGSYYFGAVVDASAYFVEFEDARTEPSAYVMTSDRHTIDLINFENNASLDNQYVTISGSNTSYCSEDAQEPNDYRSEASPLLLGYAATEGNYCDDRADWYEFTALNTGSFIMSASEHVGGVALVSNEGDVISMVQAPYRGDAEITVQLEQGDTIFFKAMPDRYIGVRVMNTYSISINEL